MVEKVTGGAAFGTGITTIALAWLEANAVGIGALCTLVTTFVYVYITLGRNRRDRRRHNLKMEEMEGRLQDSEELNRRDNE